MPQPDSQAANNNTLSGRQGSSIGSSIKSLLMARESSVVVVLVALLLVMFNSSVRGPFFSQQNILNTLLQVALLAIYAIGETVVIITGGIDLSLGSLMAFTGMVLAMSANALHHHYSMTLVMIAAISFTLLVSLFIGAIHGVLVAWLKLPAFVVTLASLTLLRSQALVLNNQLPVTISQYGFLNTLANGQFFANTSFAVPIPFVLMIVLAVISHLILARSPLGRYIYSVGSNEQAARLSGIDVAKVKLFVYCLSAVLGGIAGILFAGYGQQGDPTSAVGYELNAVAAAVIGGANLMGGEGSIMGTILGAALLEILLAAINIKLANPTVWQGTVVGGVLLFAVLASAFQQRKNRPTV